jgi:hypothetical protein
VNTTPDPINPAKSHPQCKLCRDGTYATATLQTFQQEDYEWSAYCDPCLASMASVIRDAQKRTVEIRRLPPPPEGKAAPKAPKVKVEAPPKVPKGSRGKAATLKVEAPPPAPVVAPKPPVEVKPRMSLAEAMRPTAPRPVPVVPAPAQAPPPPAPAKSAKNALRDAARDVEGYDLLTMLGMKR